MGLEKMNGGFDERSEVRVREWFEGIQELDCLKLAL